MIGICPLRALPSAMLALLLGITPGAAVANTMSQTLPPQLFHLDSNTSSALLVFDPFNASLGTLQSVLVSFNDVPLTQSWWLKNLGSTDFSYTASLTGATFTISDGFDSLSPEAFAPDPKTYSGSVSGGATATGSGSLSAAGGQLPLINTLDPVVVLVSYNPGDWHVDANGSIATLSSTSVDGSATVTYNYTVPDGGPGLLAGGLWIALGLLAWLFERGLPSRRPSTIALR